MHRLWSKDFIFITVATFLAFFNLQMILPTLPPFIHQHIGGDTIIGISNAVWAASAVLTRMLMGRILQTADVYRTLWLAVVVYTVATAGYLLASSVVVLLIVRFIYGIGFGLITTTLGTMVVKVIPTRRLGEGMGYFGLSTSLAMAVAPMVGLTIYNHSGFSALIDVAAVLMAISMFVLPLLSVRGRPSKGEYRKVKSTAKMHWGDFYDPAILLPSLLIILLSVTYGGLVSFLALFGSKIGIANVGTFFLVDAAAIAAVRPLGGRLYDRMGHMFVIPIGSVLTFAGLLVLSFTGGQSIYFVTAAVLYGLGYGLLQPTLQTWMFERLSDHRRSIGSGAFYSSVDLGLAIGSVILGLVAEWIGYADMYRVASVFILALFVVYAVFGIRGNGRHRHTAIRHASSSRIH